MSEDRDPYTPDSFNGCEYRCWLANQYYSYAFAESPIEALLASAVSTIISAGLEEAAAPIIWPHAWFYVDQQFQFGPYRADICLCVETSLDDSKNKLTPIVAIECDGHDFHQKNKQQAARDKKRDRWFAQNGVPLLRFTGSEIFKDPFQCAFEVSRLAESLIHESKFIPILKEDRFAQVG